MINGGSDIDICRENILRHTAQSGIISDALEYHLETAAKIICAGTKSVGNFDEDFEGIRANYAVLSKDGGIPVGIYKYVADVLFDGGIYSLADNVFPRRLPDTATAVYVRNAFADRAFDLFSKDLPGLRYAYAGGFSEACEAVYDGRYESVLLPTGGDTGGIPGRTRSLIRTYGLKMIGRRAVGSGGDTAAFGLFAGDIYVDRSKLGFDAELSLEIVGSPSVLIRCLTLAVSYGARVTDLHTPDRGGRITGISLSLSPQAIPPILCLAAAESDDFDITGFSPIGDVSS